MNDIFLNPDSWAGGTFDALMFFGLTGHDRTTDIANWMWTYDRLNGPYQQMNIPMSQQSKVVPNFTDDCCDRLVGVYRHRDGLCSPFVHTTILDDAGLWIYAGIPMGGFPEDWDIGAYPFNDGKPTDWMLPFINDLRLLTAYVRQRFPILIASYGCLDATICDIFEDALKGKIGNDRWYPIELQTEIGLQYYPISKLEPLIAILPIQP
jgi:hypothetical protein